MTNERIAQSHRFSIIHWALVGMFCIGLALPAHFSLAVSSKLSLVAPPASTESGAPTPNAAVSNGACAAIAYGQSMNEAITNAGEQDCFTFSGAAGQRVTVFLDNRTSCCHYFALTLTGPSGSQVGSCDFNAFDCQIDNVTLPDDGLYTITVDGRDASVGNYTIVLNRQDGDAEPIGFGQAFDRSLSPMGDQDSFSFSGTSGQRVTVFLDNQTSCCHYFALRLIGPRRAPGEHKVYLPLVLAQASAGSTPTPAENTIAVCDFNAFDCQIDNVTLPDDGLYTITVDGRDASVGNYTIVLNRLDGDAEPIAFGQALNRSLSPMGDQDSFSFSGTSGQRVTIFLDNQTSCCHYFALTLTGSSGSQVGSCDFNAFDCQIDNVTLPDDGLYTITVDGRDASVGNYTIVLNRLDGDAEPIAFGQALNRSLSPMGDQDSFSFSGTSGQRVTIFLDNQTSCCHYFALTLTGPSGSQVGSCDFNAFDCQIDNVTLPDDGLYTITVDGRDASVGNYTIVLNRLDGDAEPITFGQALNRSLSPMGDQDSFSFSGTSGQRVTVFLDNQTSCCHYFALTLTSPSGSQVGSCDFNAFDCQIDNITLPDNGLYTITVDGRDASVGNYALTLTLLGLSAEPIDDREGVEHDLRSAGDEGQRLKQ